MSWLRMRVGAMCLILSAAALYLSLPSAHTLTADEKAPGDSSAVSSDATAASDKAPADKKDSKASKDKAAAKKSTAAKKEVKKEAAPRKKDAPATPAAKGTGTPAGSSLGGGTVPMNGPGGSGSTAPVLGNTTSGKSATPGNGGGKPQGNSGAAGGGGNGGGTTAASSNRANALQAAGQKPAHQGPDPEVVNNVTAVQDRHTPKLLEQKGVVGTSTGLDEKGNVVFNVYLNGGDDPVIPKSIEGVTVRTVMAGPIYPNWQVPQRQQRLPRAVPIGTSAFAASSLCATGTLGCRLRSKSGEIFALSNNHVFALENEASLGTKIYQPGALDFGCTDPAKNDVGELYKFIPMDFTLTKDNLVDAAIMRTSRERVNTSTLADGYGVPRSDIAKPFLGQKLQKYGRTTGYTKGVVVAINATIIVGYTTGPARFTKQIDVLGEDGGFPPFGGPGDSGSLVVDEERRPVGLLFAGGGFPITHTFLNYIDEVLKAFDIEGLEVDGSEPSIIGKDGSSVAE